MFHKSMVIFLISIMISGGILPVMAGNGPMDLSVEGPTVHPIIPAEEAPGPLSRPDGRAMGEVGEEDGLNLPLASISRRKDPNSDQVPNSVLPSSGRSGPDVTPKNISFNSTDKTWNGYSVGTVNMNTDIVVFITNIGDQNATDVGVRIEIKDFFNNVMNFTETTVADIAAGSDAAIYWTNWVPMHSAKIHATVTLTMVGDADPSNDIWTYYGSGWWVNKWLDMSGDQGQWSGDVSTNEWHITDSVEADPNPAAHTAPYTWYAGTESQILGDFYTANMNVSLISKSIDLKRMNPYYPTFLNFKYYGATLPSDGISLFVSIDNGATWVDTRSFLSGLTMVGGQPAWLVRIDNWVDLDEDGQRDDGEYDVGIDISEFVGHDVKFKFTFISGPASTGLGFYLDDVIVYGFEAENEIALVTIGNMGTTHINETEDVVASFWNLGTDASPSMTTRMRVIKDTVEISSEDKVLDPIASTGDGDVVWSFKPTETGDYKIEVELLSPPLGEDSSILNNKQTRRVHVSTGNAGILLVDDDGGRTNSGRLRFGSYEVDTDYFIVSALEDRELDVYHVLYNEEGPDMAVLSDYHTVIWSTGWDGTGRSIYGTLAPLDRVTLSSYLDSGGSLWLTSQETIYDIMDPAPGFLANYLHVSDSTDDAGTPSVVRGVSGNEITDGMSLSASVKVPGNDRADAISPDGQAHGMTYQDDSVQSPTTGPFNGINFNGSYKLVYTSFELSALSLSSDRTALSLAIVDWLYSGLTMIVDEPSISVEIGEEANYTIRINNHGGTNRTIRDLRISFTDAGWSSSLDPMVINGAPETVVSGFGVLLGHLVVTTPPDAVAWSEGRVVVQLVVDDTGETFENATYTTVKETVLLDVSVSPGEQTAESGKNASYLVSLVNRGNVRTSVNLSLDGNIETWATLDQAFAMLDPGESEGIVLTLSIPRDGTSGNYSLDVVAKGRYKNIEKTGKATLNVTVGQFYSLKISSVRAPDGGQIDPKDPNIDIIIEVDNRGNGADLVNITLSGTFQNEDAWQWGSNEVLIPAFSESFRTNASLRIWDKAEGGDYNISVTATSSDGRTVAHGFVIITVLRPDLYVTLESLTFDYDIVAGRDVDFSIRVFNGGLVDSEEANISIYKGSGDILFHGTTGGSIKAGGFKDVSVTWTPSFKGPVDLDVRVNEDKAIVEMGYENNSVTRAIIVYQPDLEVGPMELQFYVNGKVKDNVRIGDEVSITARVKNMDDYSYKAKDVVVEFYLDGELLSRKTTDIQAGNQAYLSVEWKAKKGTHLVEIKVDPENKIVEADEDDNSVSRDIFVKPKDANAFSMIDPLYLGIIIAIAIVVAIAYALVRGVIPTPFRQSQVEIAERTYRCNECSKKIRKGKEYYHCACGARSHIRCALRAELCECLRRVRIDE